uniref:Cytochrome P450 n=1 Tax=Kwoniella dejecticola CBS 10117 TaxID=1296121 RepID=A0A1A6AAX6_9TREE|nr:uncharacterized protein I303_03228 [Kwoniella dejecticola CBS 10117]OBR87204.1 hypothetical protein I303_03228 [Kwoniella dejecticola CBS 10117]
MSSEAEDRLEQGEKGSRVAGLLERIFLVAGHETTGHTLTFLQAFLALHPEWQEKLYQEIISVCGDEPLSYRHMNQLNLCLAACYETIRLREIVMTLPKIATKDTLLPYTRWDDQGNVSHHQHFVKKGSHVIIDSPALSLNPFIWEDPNTFNPERFIDNGRVSSAIDEFAGFSLGQRQCIGKRFAEVEMVCYVSHLIGEFKIYPIRERGESDEDLRERLLRGREELTLTPGRIGIRLEMR